MQLRSGAGRLLACGAALLVLWYGAATARADDEPQGVWSFAPVKGRAPTPRYQYALTRYNGDPIIYGGTKGNLRSGAELNDLWRFNTALGIWEELVSVNGMYPQGLGRWGSSLTVRGDHLILFAGCNTQTYLNDVWVFSMTGRTWEQVSYPYNATLPMPRQAFGAVVRSSTPNLLYITGGIGQYASLRDMWTLNLDTFEFKSVVFENTVYTADGHGSPQWTGGKGVSTRYRPAADTIIAAFGTPQLPNEEVNVNYVSEFSFASWNWTRRETTNTPEPRNLASHLLYNDQLFVFGGWSDLTQLGADHTFKLDLNTWDWTQLPAGDQDPDVRDSMSMISLTTPPPELLEVAPTVQHAAFFFAGWGDAISNDVFYLDTDNGTWYKAHDLQVIPLPRSSHASAVHGYQMVMHGGADAVGNIFSDFWVLDTLTGAWTQISPPGSQPAARHSHGACMIGDEFYLFGGVTAAGLSDETWHYSFVANTWRQITYTFDLAVPVDPPAARRNMGLASSSLFMYVVAGKGNVELYNDVMELDTVTGLWRVVSPNTGHDPVTDEQPADWPEPRFQFGFGVFLYPIPFTSDVTLFNVNITAPLVDTAFVVWGGLSNTATQLNDIWMFRLSNATWAPGFNTELRARSLVGSTTQGQRKFISTGGQIYEDMVNEMTVFEFQVFRDQLALKHPLVINITEQLTQTESDTGRTPPPLAAHTTVAIADKLYTFGGFSSLPPDVSTTTTVVPALTLNQVYVLSLSPLCPIGVEAANGTQLMQEEDSGCFMCAPGSFATPDPVTGNVTCPLCAAGRYSSFFGATQCTLCAPGFYSGLQGAASPVSCVACETGTYNNVTGASACLVCPAGANCPAATITPTFGALSSLAINGQPQPLQSLTEERLEKQNNVLYGALGNIGLAILVICVIIKINHEETLKDFDMYPREHRPLCQEHRIMKEWKTSLGGMFSVCGIIFVLYFIVIQSLDWLDAVRETRSLIPNLSAPPNLITSAEFTIALSFQNYGDNCVDPSSPINPVTGRKERCVRAISASTTALTVGSTELACIYDTTSQPVPVCNVSFVCHACNLTQAVGSVGFSLDQSLSYATSIVWNFTTSTGVPPDQVSFYQSTISSDPGRSFRGATPTVVNLQITRTLFEDRTGADPDGSGYQIEFLTNVTGSQVSAALFQYARSVGFQFSLQRSETTFEIVRESILTTATFIASLLGGVSGVLAGVGALLSIAERGQLYFANKKAVEYTNELGRKMLPENLPLEGKEFEKHDWIIASLFAPVSARLASWEAEAQYEPPQPVPPPPPRSFVAWEWAAVVFIELATYSIPLRIFSSVTDDAEGDENTYATTILLDWFRSVFFMWISSRLTGNAGFSHHYFKFDKLFARAILYSIVYIGMLLPSGASAGQSLAVVSEFLANVSLMGHTRVLQRFHVWTPTTLMVYKCVRLYAPLLFACSSGAYVVTSANPHKDLVLLWLLVGIDFYNESFVHVCAFVIRKKKTKAQLALQAKRRAEREARRKAELKAQQDAVLASMQVVQPTGAVVAVGMPGMTKRDSLNEAAGDRISTPGLRARGLPHGGSNASAGTRSNAGTLNRAQAQSLAAALQAAQAGGASPSPAALKMPRLSNPPSNASAGSAAPAAAAANTTLQPPTPQATVPPTPMSPGGGSSLGAEALPLSPHQLTKLHAGRHSRSHSASSLEIEPRVSVSDHVGHDPEHHKLKEEGDMGVSGLLLIAMVVVEILSSFGPIGRVYDDSHQAGTKFVTVGNSTEPIPVTDTVIDGGDKGYENGVAATVILSWARTLFWTACSLHIVKWDRAVWFQYLTTMDFLTARVLIMQIAYTVNLFEVNKSSLAWVCVFTDWIMILVFNAYIRITFKCIKWHSTVYLTLYKAQRFIAPIVYISTGIAILSFPLYDTQPETFLFYLICAILYYADIINRYWHVPALDDPHAVANSRAMQLKPGSKAAKQAALKAKQLEAFDPRDTRPKAPLTHPMPQWLFNLTVAVEILSSSGPVFRIVSEDASESGNHDAQVNNLVTTFVLSLARIVFWLYVSERQRGNAMWDDYLVLDNLTLASLLQTIAYGNLSVQGNGGAGGWVGLCIISDIVMALVLAGHVRVMVKHYQWDFTNLFVYRLQRLYGPALWLLVGVIYQWKASDSSTKAPFVLYLICGVAYLFDLYSRVTKIKDVAPKSAEQRELERVQAYLREREARNAARAALSNEKAGAAGAAGIVASPQRQPGGTPPGEPAEVTVIELPTLADVKASARGSRQHLEHALSKRKLASSPEEVAAGGAAGRGSVAAAAAPTPAPAPAPAELDMSAATATPTNAVPTVKVSSGETPVLAPATIAARSDALPPQAGQPLPPLPVRPSSATPQQPLPLPPLPVGAAPASAMVSSPDTDDGKQA